MKIKSAHRAILSLLLTSLIGGCMLFTPEGPSRYAVDRARTLTMEATAYCPCGKCCGWRRNWLFRPVIASGKNRGKPKAVGITASGTKAKPGTIAADTRHYPFGTVLYVPGYGYGVVEDRGGDIQGPQRLDLFYNAHQDALDWGRRKIRVLVFPPGTPPVAHRARPPR